MNYMFKKLEKEVIKKNGDKAHKLSDFDAFKNDILEEIENAKYNGLEEMV